MTIVENENETIFKLPIAYIENKKTIEQHIVTDLELRAKNEKNEKSLYDYVFNPSNQFSQKTVE